MSSLDAVNDKNSISPTNFCANMEPETESSCDITSVQTWNLKQTLAVTSVL